MTKAQNRAVWASARRLGLDNEMLHDFVRVLFRKKSLKELTVEEGAILISRLNNTTRSAENANHKQIGKIKALFEELKFSESKRKEWICRVTRLNTELTSSEFLQKLKAKEATKLIASLVKVKKYIGAKNDVS